MTSSPASESVTKDFFDFVNYNVCRAVSETLGKEQAEGVYRRAGEIGYSILKERGIVKTEGLTPVEVLTQIVEFLEASGYMRRIEVNHISDVEMEVDMYGVSVLASSMKLTGEGYAPSHFMTNLMFAALRDLGFTGNLDELTFEGEIDQVREHWQLVPVSA